ncbi:hypothetical protein PMX22_11640 [Clostridium butyricum]|uniref:hypothetical protein n=1 Tax=Clostridium butyricum TaxID=1492 RepID=UPI00232C677D|nr:hypothetical protein [Clostridium butyricum]MDB2160458.1 hypothetical protein [Clostridium butyricum]
MSDKGGNIVANTRYMLLPLGLTERQLLIYQKLYEKCNFSDMTVKYTINQLSCDIKILDISAKTIYRDIQIMISKGYLQLIKRASKGNAPIYKIVKIAELTRDIKGNQERTEIETKHSNINIFNNESENQNRAKREPNINNLRCEPTVNQEETKGKPKHSNIKALSSDKGNQRETKREPSVHPIKEKEKDNIYKKEKDTSLDKIINSYSQDEELINTIRDFLKMRKAIKKPVTDRALKIMINKLDKYADTTQKKIMILENSIENSWQGIFPLKENIIPINSKANNKKLRGWD